jgi:cytoskeleton protein RodZ
MNKNAMTSKEIGKLFLEQRERLKLTVDEVNRRTHIHLKVIRDIESGVFDNIGPIYLKSFLKKYSDFLGLDTIDILKRYSAISSSIPKREFSVGGVEEKEEKRSVPVVDVKKKMQAVLVVFLAGVLLTLVFILIVVMRAAMTSPHQGKPEVKAAKIQAKPSVVKPRESKAPVESKSLASRIKSVVAPANEAVSLTLKAKDEVWVQVKFGDKKLFDGILKKGESRSWNSEGMITVWTGKANMLEFTVNKQDAGVVAAGVVKNIKVSAEGIRIGDAWVKRFK